MSLPSIPDVKAETTFTNKEALKLLLNSVEFLNQSLSKLFDAEIGEVRLIVDTDECSKLSTHDIINICQNINQALKNTISLQMLLHLKLENILDAAIGTISVVPTRNTTEHGNIETANKISSSKSNFGKSKCSLKTESCLTDNYVEVFIDGVIK